MVEQPILLGNTEEDDVADKAVLKAIIAVQKETITNNLTHFQRY